MQMMPYLLGQGVFDFVDGSNTCPSPHVLVADGTSLQVNQLFLHWKQQDQLIVSALLSSLSMEVLHLIVGCQTSCSAWRTLEQALASTSNSRIMQLHGSLQDLRQGDESVTQFMQKVKALFDELAVVGRPVSLKDFNLYVFRGLRGEFKDLVTSLVNKAEPLPYANLHSHVLTHEFIHKSSHQFMGSAAIHAPLLPMPNTPPSVFVAQCQTFGNFGRNRGRFNRGWRPNQFSSRGNYSAISRLDHHSLHNREIGREIGSVTGGSIHAANCAKLSAIPLPIALNSSIEFMASSLLQIWHCVISPPQVLPIGFRTLVPINTSHRILQPWLLQNRILVMIICMLVMVRAFPYLISVIQKYIHRIVLLPCLMFFMFLQSRNLCFLFRNFILMTMFILNFTLLCFMSRISTPMQFFSQVRVKMVSMP
jgi:hypothetical protein